MKDQSWRQLPFPLVDPALLAREERNFMGHDLKAALPEEQQHKTEGGLQRVPPILTHEKIAVVKRPLVLENDTVVIRKQPQEPEKPGSAAQVPGKLHVTLSIGGDHIHRVPLGAKLCYALLGIRADTTARRGIG